MVNSKNTRNLTISGVSWLSSHHLMFHGSAELHQPCRPGISHAQQFPFSVLCDLYKAVVVIIKLCFVAVGKDLFHRLEPVRKPAQDNFPGNVMSSSLHTVLDPGKALLCGIQADVVQADVISLLPCFFAVLSVRLPDRVVSWVKETFFSRQASRSRSAALPPANVSPPNCAVILSSSAIIPNVLVIPFNTPVKLDFPAPSTPPMIVYIFTLDPPVQNKNKKHPKSYDHRCSMVETTELESVTSRV